MMSVWRTVSLFIFEGYLYSRRLTYDPLSLTNGLEILQLGVGNISICVCLKYSKLINFSKACDTSPIDINCPNYVHFILYYILFLLEMIHKGQNYVATGTLLNKFKRRQPCAVQYSNVLPGLGWAWEMVIF